MTRCLTVLGTCLGVLSSHTVPSHRPVPHHPDLRPPFLKRFSGPFPLCVPLSGEGGQQLLLSTAFGGGLDPPSRLCLLGGLAALVP